MFPSQQAGALLGQPYLLHTIHKNILAPHRLTAAADFNMFVPLPTEVATTHEAEMEETVLLIFVSGVG